MFSANILRVHGYIVDDLSNFLIFMSVAFTMLHKHENIYQLNGRFRMLWFKFMHTYIGTLAKVSFSQLAVSFSLLAKHLYTHSHTSSSNKYKIIQNANLYRRSLVLSTSFEAFQSIPNIILYALNLVDMQRIETAQCIYIHNTYIHTRLVVWNDNIKER